MKLIGIIPKVFYSDINVGLKLFVDCLGFSISYNDLKGKPPFCVVRRDATKLCLMEDAEYAAKDRPEIRIETDDIEAYFREVMSRHPEMLHPNCKGVSLKPWGLKEFAVKDSSDVCIIVQQ